MGLNASQNVGPFEELGPRSPKDRARSAILGAFVADAASMPLNRIYDQGALDKLLRGRSRGDHSLNKQKHEQGRDEEEVLEPEIPEFFSPCSCPFYNLPNGENSPYGKEAYPLLHSISSCGFFDKEQASEFMFICMRGPEFPADEKEFRVSVAAEEKDLHHGSPPSNEKSGSSFNSPLRLYIEYQQQPRLCGSLSRLFLEHRLQGRTWEQCASSSDIQCLGLVCVPIIVARYAGSGSRMIDAVEA